MYESLSAHCNDFHLYIFAFDDLTRDILQNLNPEKVTVVSLDEFETDELKEVKKDRSRAEYCWTCTPSIISHVLKNYKVQDCTYIDSDLYFYSDPTVLLEELEEYNKNVLITEHRYSYLPRLHGEKRAGRFCVQFLTIRNEENSLKVLEKWRNQCIGWCYARHEDGKFGDQKYLDEWPVIYDNTHILRHHGGGIAPWNLQQYFFYEDGRIIKGKVKKSGLEFSVVFYHFQYVKFLEDGSYDIGWYQITSTARKLFYKPYLKKIEGIEARLMTSNLDYHRTYFSFNGAGFKNILKKGAKRLLGYNIMNIK
jgi:hypothetical protein